jgi:1-acyl-sn-glycerol-3-phosphate acyltransferase
VRLARAVWRLLRLGVHTLHGMAICAVLFPFLKPPQRMARVGWWSARMLEVLGVRWVSSGAPHVGPVLYVANHISWLDILAINAVQPVRFVAKADVRHWPLLGWLVACGGTLFIERERKRDALRVVHQIAQALRDGEIVAVFPEGTTGAGHALLPFHANLLQAAISVDAPVQPIALRYSDPQHAVSPAVAYVGDTSLAQSMWWIACASGLKVSVDLLDAQRTTHLDRRALAARLSNAIAQQLGSVSPWGL